MAAAVASLIAAILLLDVSVTFHNVWPTPSVAWSGEISVELAVAVAALAAVTRAGREPPRALIAGLSLLWIVLSIGRYAETTAPALYGRDVNLYWDLRFVPDVIAMVTRVVRAWQIGAAMVAVAAVTGGVYWLVRSAWNRVGRALLNRGDRLTLEVLAALTIVWFIGQQTSEHFLP